MQVQARARRPGRSPGVSVHQETRVGGRGVEGKRWSLERAARIIIITDELRVWRRRRRSVARASSLGRRAARRSRRDDAVSIDTRLSTSVRRDTKTTLGCHADLWTSEVFPPSPKRRARKKRGRLESGKKRLSRGDPGGARSKRRDRARSPVLGRERGADTRRAGLEEARRARTAGGRRESATLCNETLREKTPEKKNFVSRASGQKMSTIRHRRRFWFANGTKFKRNSRRCFLLSLSRSARPRASSTLSRARTHTNAPWRPPPTRGVSRSTRGSSAMA